MEPDPSMLDPTRPSGSSSQTIGSHDDADDPVVASYNILLKPQHPPNRTVMILEHPNKPEAKKQTRAPVELRLKTNTGMVELDYAIDYNSCYDRSKGLNWGTNLHKSTEAKKGGSHGLAGGFGVGAPPPRARGGRGGDDILDLSLDWSEALRRDYVLRTQTMGGQISETTTESKYMVGVFSGKNLHLTPASSLVQLRPQLHHIDATTEQERLASTRGGGAAAGAAAGKDTARAIHMTIKQTKDGGDEELVQETMADRLRKVQMEAWRRMRFVHDEAAESWVIADEALYLGSQQAPGAADGKQPAGEGHGDDELAEKVASLRTRWDEDDMLEKISGIKLERNVKLEISDDEPADKGKGKGKAVNAGPSKPAGRMKATATSKAATTRGKRSTTGANKPGAPNATKDD